MALKIFIKIADAVKINAPLKNLLERSLFLLIVPPPFPTLLSKLFPYISKS